MRPYSFSRKDLLEIVFFFITAGLISLLATFAIHPLGGLILLLFSVGIIPLVKDMVSKDHYEPPYFRCEGCGKLYPKSKKETWKDHSFCSMCSRDKESQKQFAVKFPLWFKRFKN